MKNEGESRQDRVANHKLADAQHHLYLAWRDVKAANHHRAIRPEIFALVEQDLKALNDRIGRLST